MITRPERALFNWAEHRSKARQSREIRRQSAAFSVRFAVQNDLTYFGSAAWLANIPAWARAKFFYPTTSFTEVWWRCDYCGSAMDLFPGDPEDGVVDRVYTQLPGANNLGHKIGWCPTSGIRDRRKLPIRATQIERLCGALVFQFNSNKKVSLMRDTFSFKVVFKEI